jgi:hypothetical protein
VLIVAPLAFAAAAGLGFVGATWWVRRHQSADVAPEGAGATATTTETAVDTAVATTDASSAPSPAPQPGRAGAGGGSATVVGTVKDLGETCGFGIDIDDGPNVLPVNLADELSIPGRRLRFEYVDEHFEDDCDDTDAVRLSHVTEIGSVDVPTACADSRRSFAALTDIIDGLDKTCSQDSDCVAFGDDPRDNCSRPRFTNDTTFHRYEARHDRYMRIIAAACELASAPCDDDRPGEPACVEGRCQPRE